MSDVLKKIVLGFFIFINVFFCLFSQEKIANLKDLETRLSLSTKQERIDILIKLTQIYSDKSPQIAIKYGLEAMHLIDSFFLPEFLTNKVLLSNALCTAYLNLKDYKNAGRFIKKAIEISESNNIRLGYAEALYNKGLLTYFQGHYSQSVDFLSKTLFHFKEDENTRGVAKSLALISKVYWKFQDYPRALEFAKDAKKFYERIGDDENLAFVSYIIGNIYKDMGAYEKALKNYQEALEKFQENDHPSKIIEISNQIALIYKDQSNLDEALNYLKNSYEFSKTINDKNTEAIALNNLGALYEEKRDISKALKLYTQSLNIRESITDKKGISETLINLGRISGKLKKYNAALKYIQRAIKIAGEIEEKKQLMNGYKELAIIYEAQNNVQLALINYKKFKTINDEIFSIDINSKISKMQTQFDFVRKENVIEILKKDQEINELNLTKQKNVKNSFIIISLLVLILAFVIFARYKLKIKANQALKNEIIEHQQTSQKLRESEGKFRALAEKSVVGIYIIHEDCFKYVNPKFLKIFGYSSDEIIGKESFMMVLNEDKNNVSKILKQSLFEKQQSLNFDFRGMTKEGSVLFLESFVNLANYQGEQVIMGTLIDVTDRKKAESELAKSQKLESIGILAGGIAHDFNNLLAVITGNISMALDEVNKDKHISPLLKSAEKSSHQAAELTQKLITFSKGGWPNPHKVSLSSIIKTAKDFSPSLKKILQSASITIPKDLKPIFGDEYQLRQVLYNVLQNAQESADSELHIDINAKNITIDENEARNLSLNPGDYILVSIADNGRGIPQHLMNNIFDPYISTKDMVTQKGLGLGLAICYSIVKKHNGHISVDSEVGKGTTVILYLPVHQKGIKEF